MSFSGAVARAIAASAIEGDVQKANRSRIHHRICAVLPVLTAKRTDRQVQLHVVIEDAVSAEHFHLSVSEDVPCCAKPWSNFVAPTKLDRPRRKAACRCFAGEVFLFDTHPGVYGELLA